MALECRGLKLSAEYFMSDFEIAIRDSFVNHFPQNEAKSCAFHFTKAKRSDNEEATNFGSKGEAPRGEKEKSIRRKYDKKFHPGCSLQEVSQFVEKTIWFKSGSKDFFFGSIPRFLSKLPSSHIIIRSLFWSLGLIPNTKIYCLGLVPKTKTDSLGLQMHYIYI